MQKKKIINKWSKQIVIDESSEYREMWNVVLGGFFTFFFMFIVSLIGLNLIIKDIPTFNYLITLFLKWPLSYFGYFKEDLEIFFNSLNIIKFVITTFLSITSSLLVANHYYQPLQNFKIKKGKTLVDDDTAKEKLKNELQEQINLTPNEIPQIKLVDDIYIAESRLKQHTAIVGGTGAGKTVLQMPIYKQIIDKNYLSLFFDFKGDMDKTFWKKDSKIGIFGIGDIRSWVWDIGTEIYNESMADAFANYIITASETEDNKMWSSSAREVYKGILYMLIDEKKENGTHFGARDILAIASQDIEILQPIIFEYNSGIQKILTEANVTALGVLLNMDAFLAPLKALAKMEMDLGRSNLFTFHEWMFSKNPKYRQIIWTFDEEIPDYKVLYALFFNFIVAKLSSKSYGDNKDKPLYLCFDELAQLQKINFKKIIEIGRSKNIRFICGYQDHSQMKKIYGQDDLDLMMSSMQTQIFGAFSQGATSKYLSGAIGNQVLSVFNISNNQDTQSKNLSISEKEKALVLPTYFSEKLGEVFIDGERYFRLLVVMPKCVYNIPFPLKAISDIEMENNVDISIYKSNYHNISTKKVYDMTDTISKYPKVKEMVDEKNKVLLDAKNKKELAKKQATKVETDKSLINALLIKLEKLSSIDRENFYLKLRVAETIYFDKTDEDLEMILYSGEELSSNLIEICLEIIEQLQQEKLQLSQ